MTEPADLQPKLFLQLPSVNAPLEQTGTLSCVTKEGEVISIKCTIAQKTEDSDRPGYIDLNRYFNVLQKTWYVKREDFWKVFTRIIGSVYETELVEGTDEKALEEKVGAQAEVNKIRYLARVQKIAAEAKEKGRPGKLGARIFHVITGIVATPTEMAMGLVRLAIATAAVAGGALALLGVKVAKRKQPLQAQQLEIKEKWIGEFVGSSIHQVRIALLQLIPIIGPQLANQYRETGSLKGFLDAPAIGGLLGKIGLNVAQVVYGPRMTEDFKRSSEGMRRFYAWRPVVQNEAYLKKKMPTRVQANVELRQEMVKEKPQPVLIRIPVKKGDKTIRYHDGTFLFSTQANPKRINAPTVIMYHGNAMHRDHFLESKQVTSYLQQGYNVLLASYAGDFVSADSKENSTKCSEAFMREDAKADIEFLSHLGVENIGVYGFSLGGAQAMNVAQAVPNEGMTVDFITLDKTFTDAVSASGRVVKNKTSSSALSRIATSFARRFFLEETEGKKRAGCDCLNNKKKLEEVVTRPPFANTKYTFIGGREDWLMGDQRNKDNNFSLDLYLAVQPVVKERAQLFITREGHEMAEAIS